MANPGGEGGGLEAKNYGDQTDWKAEAENLAKELADQKRLAVEERNAKEVAEARVLFSHSQTKNAAPPSFADAGPTLPSATLPVDTGGK